MTKHKNFSIEQECDGSFSAYHLSNSMYDVMTGFKSIKATKTAIDAREDEETARWGAFFTPTR